MRIDIAKKKIGRRKSEQGELRSKRGCPGAGFTLLELLAVLIIMAALSVIAIPIFTNRGEEAKLTTDNQNKQILQKQVQMYMMEESVSGPVENILQDMVDAGHLAEVPSNPFKNTTNFEDKEYILSVDSNGKSKLTLASPFDGVANAPNLTHGMTPVKYNGSDWVKADATNTGNDWYKYNGDVDNTGVDTNGDGISDLLATEKWANIELADGSMFVWIPRYTYKVTHIDDADATNDKIEIKYSKGLADDTSGGYTIHPAFTFDKKEVTGIWVSKFEPTYDGVTNTSAGDNTADKAVQVLPNVVSWRYINIGNAYQAARNMEEKYASKYGINKDTIDTHMMKNDEWGAVAYLTEAIRDGEEVWINNYVSEDDDDPGAKVITGLSSKVSKNAGMQTYANGSEDPRDDLDDSDALYLYNENLDADYAGGGARASSTGNVYGVYDLVGGAWERVASYLDNPAGVGSRDAYGSQLLEADNKYKNVLTASGGTFDVGADDNAKRNNNYGLTSSQTSGMALHEIQTSGVGNSNFRGYSDYQYFPSSSNPFFVRGGSYYSSSNAGIGAVGNTNGSPDRAYSFRVVVVALP